MVGECNATGQKRTGQAQSKQRIIHDHNPCILPRLRLVVRVDLEDAIVKAVAPKATLDQLIVMRNDGS
jgi:hypothetical protein